MIRADALFTTLRDAAWLTPARVKAYLYLLGAITLAVVLSWIGLSRHGLDLLGKPLGADFPELLGGLAAGAAGRAGQGLRSSCSRPRPSAAPLAAPMFRTRLSSIRRPIL